MNIQIFSIYLKKKLGFPGGLAVKKSTSNEGDLGSIPGFGRSPGEGNSYPLQYSGLEKSMDCIVHGVTKSQIRLSDFHFHVKNSEKADSESVKYFQTKYDLKLTNL